MANKEISALTAASTPLDGTELAHLLQGANSRKATVEEIRGVTRGLNNMLINGAHQINQEGDIVITAGNSAYTIDLFLVDNDTNQTVTVTRELHTPGQTDVPGSTRHKMRLNFSSAPTTGTIRIAQRIESAYTNQNLSASARAYFTGPTGSETLACEVVQHFGTTGSPSTDVTTAASSLDIATIYSASTQERKAAFSVPSISTKTLGTDGNDYLELAWVLTPRQSGNYEVSRMSFVEGDASEIADTYDEIDASVVLDKCQYFYIDRLGTDQNYIWSGDITTSNSYLGRVYFSKEMRDVPSMTLSGHSASGFTSGSVSSNTVTTDGFRFTNTSNGTQARGFFAFTWSANARL